MNRNGELSSSLSSIAMAGVEADRPSRNLVFLAMRASGIGVVDAMITVSLCPTLESQERRELTGGRLGASGGKTSAP